MKNKIIILSIASLSVILISQATLKLYAVPSSDITVYLVDASVHNADHSEEYFETTRHKLSLQSASKDYLPDADYTLTEKIAPFIWQPPKSLIFISL